MTFKSLKKVDFLRGSTRQSLSDSTYHDQSQHRNTEPEDDFRGVFPDQPIGGLKSLVFRKWVHAVNGVDRKLTTSHQTNQYPGCAHWHGAVFGRFFNQALSPSRRDKPIKIAPPT